MQPRTILHVDLDAFFAAVEQRDRPELRGKPVVVGGGGPNQRGVVSTASYEARRFGIHSAMPLREAGRRCPDAIFLPVDGRKYLQASREVMAILRRFTPLVEPISIDEAFLDVTGSRDLFGDGPTIARAIKDAVREEAQLTISVGVATTKLVAKIASDLEKPDGLVVVAPARRRPSWRRCPISAGCGASARRRPTALREYGVRTMGDLADLPVDLLERRFGKHGSTLADRARGPTPSAWSARARPRSRSGTSTRSMSTRPTARRSNGRYSRWPMACRAAAGVGVRASTVTVKIRDSSFRTITRQRTFPSRPT